MRKMGIFTVHPKVSNETTDIHQEQPNEARCDPMEVELIIRQGVAGPSAKAQCSRPANYIQPPTGQGM